MMRKSFFFFREREFLLGLFVFFCIYPLPCIRPVHMSVLIEARTYMTVDAGAGEKREAAPFVVCHCDSLGRLQSSSGDSSRFRFGQASTTNFIRPAFSTALDTTALHPERWIVCKVPDTLWQKQR